MRPLKFALKSESGITLIELLISIAIAGILSVAVSMVFYQLFVVNASSSNRVLAVRQVQNTGYWISRDAVGAQVIVADNDPETGDFLTFRWNDWDGLNYEAIYYFTYDEDRDINVLWRSYTVGDNDPVDTMVAEYIDVTATTFLRPDSIWVLTVKATVGSFPWPSSETRIYEIMPRPPSI